MRKLFYVCLSFRQQTEKLEFCELSTRAVILSKARSAKSKNLRIYPLHGRNQVRRSFDSLRSLRMTTGVQNPIFVTAYGRGDQRMYEDEPEFVTHCQRRLAAKFQFIRRRRKADKHQMNSPPGGNPAGRRFLVKIGVKKRGISLGIVEIIH